MYYLNKIIGWCMSPLGIMFIGLAAGMALTRWSPKGKILGRWIVALALGLFWTLGCGVTTRWIGLPLEGVEDESTAGDVECDAVVVLGGGIGIHEQCGRVELFAGADRLWTGVRRWKRLSAVKRVPLVLGGGMDERIEDLTSDFGVPKESLKTLPQARNTEEEAKLIAETVSGKVLLVTSAWHMPRAKALFERAGLEVIAAPTDYEMHFEAERELRFGDFFPTADALVRNGMALKEWVARFGYAVFRSKCDKPKRA